jgi:hypothetical protein
MRSQRARPSPRRRRAALTLQVEQLEQRWCPSYSLVTSRAALAGTDSVNWPLNVNLANPFTILSNGGHSITVSKAQAGNFGTLVEGSGWGGNFAPGDVILWTHGRGGVTNPITLDFGATPVAAGGAQIDPNTGQGSFKFTAEVDAYDALGNTLASFTEKGVATLANDNSAIFIGISSSSANIDKIALQINSVQQSEKSDFAINKFDFRTSAAPSAPATSQRGSAVDLAPLAFSLLGTGQPAMSAAPLSGFAAPSAPPASQSGVLPASDATSAVPVEATDAVFAVSHAAASDDYAGLSAPLSFGSLDAM